MMYLSPYWLTALFVFVTVLLCASTIASRIHWAPKAVLIALSFVMFFVFYIGYTNSLGWPVIGSLPENFKFLSAEIRTPMPGTDEAGEIYVWFCPMSADKAIGEPRSIQMPYSRAMHKKLNEAMVKARDGEEIYMTRRKLIGGFISQNTSDADSDGLEFVKPPNTLPPKD